MVKVQWINYGTSPAFIIPDAGYMNFKSYYDQNSSKKNEVQWFYPIQSSVGSEIIDLVEKILINSPDVVAFSTYVWNSTLNHLVAKEIKKIAPNTFIVFGGPHIEHKFRKDFFTKNPYIDIVCNVDGYGEIFFTELLDQIVEKKFNPSQITFAVYPSKSRLQLESRKSYYKRDFKWPVKIYENNKDYIDHLVKNKNNGKLYLHLETSRGCPFGCVYCEWGGGINSKVNFRPTSDVLEDLSFFLDRYNPILIAFNDANFGIIKRDLDIIKLITEKRKNHPQLVGIQLYGQSKVNKELLFEIYEELAKHNLLDETVKISVQDFENNVLENIDRSFVDWEAHRDCLQNLIYKYKLTHLSIRYELILGLPGSTLETFYKSLDYLGSSEPQRYLWWLLPTSPAADPLYQNKFKLKTIKNRSKWALNENYYDFSKSCDLIHDSRFVEDAEIVVESNSYNRDEWLEMYLVNEMWKSMITSGLVISPIKYLENHRKDLTFSSVVKILLSDIFNGNNLLDPFQKELIQDLKNDYKTRIYSEETINVSRVRLSKFPILNDDLPIEVAWFLIFSIDLHAFYKNLERWAENFNDALLLESIRWNKDFFINLEYNPDNGKIVNADRDWHDITFYNGSLSLKKIKYVISDTDIFKEGPKISWHKHSVETRMTKDFIEYCKNVEQMRIFNNFVKVFDSASSNINN